MAVSKIATTYHMSDGNREDLLDVITNISPTETPMFSKFGKTKAKNTTHEWLTDSLASAGENSNIEGENYSFENLTARTRLSNQTQIFVTPVRVSDTQRAVDTAGFEDEYAYQMAKKLKEHARDIEYAIVADSASASGDTATARTLKGVLEWISTNVESGSSSATGEDLDESMFNDALQDIWDSGGQPQTVYCNGYQKRQISGFSTNTRNVAASEKELISGIDVYDSDFGRVKVIADRFMDTSKVAVLQDDLWKVAVLRETEKEEVAKVGDATRGVIKTELTLESRNEAGSGKITGLSTS